MTNKENTNKDDIKKDDKKNIDTPKDNTQKSDIEKNTVSKKTPDEKTAPKTAGNKLLDNETELKKYKKLYEKTELKTNAKEKNQEEAKEKSSKKVKQANTQTTNKTLDADLNSQSLTTAPSSDASEFSSDASEFSSNASELSSNTSEFPSSASGFSNSALNKTDAPLDASTSQETSNRTTQKNDHPKKNRHPLVKWIFLMVLIICTLAIITAVGYGFYYVYTHMSQKIDALQQDVTTLENNGQGNVSALNQKFVALEKNNEQIRTQNTEQQKTIGALNARINSAEQRLASQRKRLLSMSTTSRDDWLLAEAEYLIKLANQRMLVERNAQGASALLVEADTILKDLDDPDLFPVRQQLANDIASVKLIEKIDVEGLFLKLNALTESISKLPLNPTWQQRGELLNDSSQDISTSTDTDTMVDSSTTPDTDTTDTETKKPKPSFKDKAAAGFNAFTDKLDNYIRVRRHDTSEAEELRIATPAQAQYLQQNLQLMLERASLALLREQQTIFDNSLDQSKQWLLREFPASTQRAAFIAQINEVKSTNVIQTLPDITQSLEALKAYINELHALKDTVNQKGSN